MLFANAALLPLLGAAVVCVVGVVGVDTPAKARGASSRRV